MSKEKNNQKAIIVGAALILLVAIVTMGRNFGSNAPVKNSQNKTESKEDKKSVTASQLNMKIINKENIKIIDIRDSDSFKTEHIIDSVNLSPDDASSYFASNKNVGNFVIVDEDGSLSPEVAKQLSGMAEGATMNYLENGFSGWKNQYEPTISSGDPYSFTDQAKVKYVSADNLKKALGQSGSLYIIDVRKSDEYSDGHIKNAFNFNIDELEQKRKDIPIGKQIILYDNDGVSAFLGAVRLFDMGIFGSLVMSDKFDDWKQKGYEVVK